jgi:predicted DNA-binding transcriptional regulator AlpA
VSRTYLTVEDIAARYQISVWSVYDRSRTGAIPHRKPPGMRRLLFLEEELQAWEDGAELETLNLAGGGRVCRPSGGGA